MSKGIRLSPKHGVNPSLGLCWICGETNGEVILAGHLKDDVEAPRQGVWDRHPCSTCTEWMRQGVILIRVKDGSQDEPFRLGSLSVLKDSAVARCFGDQSPALKSRVAYVEDAAWQKMGLPT